MSDLDLYGMLAAGAIGLVFLLLRRIPIYVVCCPVMIAAFSWLGWSEIARDPAVGVLWIAGLTLCSFGLLIVRVMLIRSVSLQLLGRISAGGPAEGITEDIGARLADMEYFRLIRRADTNRLTAFGWFCSTVVVVFYAVFRIR